MELWSSILVGLALVLVASWLVHLHVRAWRALEREAGRLEAEEVDFRRRQLRRRTQTSVMLGLVGLAMLIGRLLIVWRAPPTIVLVFWAGVVLLVLWLGLLAVADIVATRHYFGRLRRDYLVERASLQAQLNRMQRLRGNGQPEKGPGSQAGGSGEAEGPPESGGPEGGEESAETEGEEEP